MAGVGNAVVLTFSGTAMKRILLNPPYPSCSSGQLAQRAEFEMNNSRKLILPEVVPKEPQLVEQEPASLGLSGLFRVIRPIAVPEQSIDLTPHHPTGQDP